jgi:hypothetical protein
MLGTPVTVPGTLVPVVDHLFYHLAVFRLPVPVSGDLKMESHVYEDIQSTILRENVLDQEECLEVYIISIYRK